MMALAMLLGSIPFRDLAVYLAGRAGKREAHDESKLGAPLLAVVCLLEAARGFVPVYAAKGSLGSELLVLLVGVVAVVSSSFPYWLMFKPRSNGLTTGLGVIAALLLTL